MKRTMALGLLLLSGPTAAGPAPLASGVHRSFMAGSALWYFSALWSEFGCGAAAAIAAIGSSGFCRPISRRQPPTSLFLLKPSPAEAHAEAYKGTAAK